MVNFCASLTTIPSRIREVSLTIDSLINQTRKPEKIFLNIPYKYERFPGQVISAEYLEKLSNYKKLLLNKANFLAISGYIWNNKKYKPLEAIKKLK